MGEAPPFAAKNLPENDNAQSCPAVAIHSLPQEETPAMHVIKPLAFLMPLFFLVSAAAADRFFDTRGSLAPYMLKVFAVRPEMLPPEGQPVDEDALRRELKARYYFARVVIVLALAEAIGIYGLVLGLLGAEQWVVHTLFALSYTGMLYIRLRMTVAWERMYLG